VNRSHCGALFGGRNLRTLTVNQGGTDFLDGSVTSSTAGIDCGMTCSRDFDFGTRVTLTATPESGAVFAGWSKVTSSKKHKGKVLSQSPKPGKHLKKGSKVALKVGK
jgi:PASTA domain/Divergent InlB B-repeat domain